MSEMNTRWRWFLRLGITYCGALGTAVAQIFAFSVNSTLAQELKPIADDSLGAESSVVTPINTQVDTINGGAIRGTNLFHSFSQFHIGEGREAYFTNPSGIENILSRVTGSDASKIFGKLGVLGNANLFLINPNGIIFGPKASLDIRGSFVASTASSFKFTDGFEFSATAPETTPLLTISVPIGLQYGVNPGSILNQSQARNSNNDVTVGLQVQPNRTLALVGGDVSLDSGILFAPGGRVELGGLASPGTVGLQVDSNNLSLGFPDNVNRASVSLTNRASVNVAASGGGNIAVNARNIDVLGGSAFQAGIGQGLGSVNSRAGDITLNATGEIKVVGSEVSNVVQTQAVGNGGNLTINTQQLLVRDGIVGAGTSGEGNGGNLTVNATDSVQLMGRSGLFAQADPGTIGDAGNLTVNTRQLLVQDGSQVSTSSAGKGNGGNLTVTADSVQLIGRFFDGQTEFGSGLFTIDVGTDGDAGNLTINTRELLVRDGAQVGTGTFGEGNGGNLTVNATDRVQLINGTNTNSQAPTGLSASNQPGASGDAGDLTINTRELLVRDGAQVATATFGEGNGGNLTVNATDSVQLIGSSNNGLTTSNQPGATGDAGDLTINTSELLVRDGAGVATATFGEGNGGNLTINATDRVQLIGSSGLLAQANPSASGDAGDLTINTQQLIVQDGSGVLVRSVGTGTAGNLTVNARSIRLDNNAILSADTPSNSTNPNREQATITLRARDLVLLRRGSQITTNATGSNVIGGNIFIDTDVLAAFENSDISANSTDFRGGRVTINVKGIFGTQFRNALTVESDITATGANPDLSGIVEVNAPDVDPNRGLVQLPTNLVDASQQIATGCTPRNGQTSTFVATGRGGLPLSPNEPLRSRAVITQWVRLDEQTGNQTDGKAKPVALSEHPARHREPIVEANGWVVDKKGDVYLVAQVPNATSSFQTTAASCLTRN